MHFRSMLFVDLPETKQDPQWEQEVLEQMEVLKAKHPGKTIESAILGLYLGRLVNVQTIFVLELKVLRILCTAIEPLHSLIDYIGQLTAKDRLHIDQPAKIQT